MQQVGHAIQRTTHIELDQIGARFSRLTDGRQAILSHPIGKRPVRDYHHPTRFSINIILAWYP